MCLLPFLIHVFYQSVAGLQNLLLHLQSNNQMFIEGKEISFNTLEEFYKWMEYPTLLVDTYSYYTSTTILIKETSKT